MRNISTFATFFSIIFLLPIVSCKKNSQPSEPDLCANVVCYNGGTCVNGNCTCPSGYGGSHCDTIMRLPYIGTFVGSFYSYLGTLVDTIIISPNAAINKVDIKDLKDQDNEKGNYTLVDTEGTFQRIGSTGSGTGHLGLVRIYGVANDTIFIVSLEDGLTTSSYHLKRQ